MKICCLLLVEDDANEAAVTRSLLKTSQLEVDDVVVATSLAEALLTIQSREVDIILLDLDLGDSRSLDTLKAVRCVTDAVVIVLSASEDELLGIETIKAGADDFLVKARMTDRCLRASIVQSMTRQQIRLTTKRINSKLDNLCEMAGVK